MKKSILFNLGALLLVSALIFTTSSCNKDDDEGDSGPGGIDQEYLDIMVGTWAVDTVTQNELETYDDWSGFTITFNEDMSYSAQGLEMTDEGAEALIGGEGSFSFNKPTEDVIAGLVFDGGRVSGLSFDGDPTAEEITFTFSLEEESSARVTSTGDYVMTVVPSSN